MDNNMDKKGVPNAIVQFPLLIATIGFTILVFWWLISDYSGDYRTNDSSLGQVSLIIIRKATNLKGEISFGSGAPLELIDSKVGPEKQIHLSFALPQSLSNKDQAIRTAKLDGEFQDNTLKATINDGMNNYPVTLTRDSLASLYKQIQGHIPDFNALLGHSGS
jgi:hypothetical protein